MRLGAFFPILGDGQRLDLAMKNGDFMGILWWFHGIMGIDGIYNQLLDEIGLHAQFSGTECRNPFLLRHLCAHGVWIPMAWDYHKPETM